jgi:hypothetical protein
MASRTPAVGEHPDDVTVDSAQFETDIVCVHEVHSLILSLG